MPPLLAIRVGGDNWPRFGKHSGLSCHRMGDPDSASRDPSHEKLARQQTSHPRATPFASAPGEGEEASWGALGSTGSPESKTLTNMETARRGVKLRSSGDDWPPSLM
jgi:hypothetical protein